MRTKTAKPISGIAEALAYGVLIGIALILMAYPANARPGFDRSAEPMSQQWQVADQLTQATMLAALGFNSERVVRQIEEARDLFDDRLHGLRSDNSGLDLVATKTPDILDEIARLEAIWDQYDATLRIIIGELRTAPRVGDAHIQDLTESHTLLIEAIDNAVDAYGNGRPAPVSDM